MEESELGMSALYNDDTCLTRNSNLELVAKQILKQEGAHSKESSPAASTELLEPSDNVADVVAEVAAEVAAEATTESTQIKDLFKSVISPPPEPVIENKDVDSVSPEEVETLFKRLNDQNRLSVTDSILSTTSTETPSTVRAAGEKTELTTSQEDLLTEDTTSVASGMDRLAMKCNISHCVNIYLLGHNFEIVLYY